MKQKITPEQQELREDFLAACHDPDFLDEVTEECKSSFVTFVDYYHMFKGWTTTRPQRMMAKWLQESEEYAFRILQAYRFSSKSHITCLYVVWRLLNDPNWTCIVISAAENLAIRNANFMRSIIEQFPPTQHLKPADPDHWKKYSFSVNRDVDLLEPSVNVSGVTSGSTGRHASMLLLDDVEILENSKTELKREEVWEKVQSFMSLADYHLYVGTPHTTDSIYLKLHETGNYHHELKIPARWPSGEMANPDVPINGKLQDEEWLKEKERGLTWGKFRSQYFLEAVDIEKSLLQVELIHLFDQELTARENPLSDTYYERWQFFIGETLLKDIVAYYDPASGLQGRDDSVLAIVAQDHNSNVYLLHVEILSPVTPEHAYSIQCREVVEACVKYGVRTVHVEKNAHPTLYRDVRNTAAKMKTRLHVREALRGPTKSKVEFIADTLEPVIRAGYFWCDRILWEREVKLRNQFKNFGGPMKHDDVIDSVAGAVSQLRLPKGSGTREKDDRPTINQEPRGFIGNAYTPFGGRRPNFSQK